MVWYLMIGQIKKWTHPWTIFGIWYTHETTYETPLALNHQSGIPVLSPCVLFSISYNKCPIYTDLIINNIYIDILISEVYKTLIYEKF